VSALDTLATLAEGDQFTIVSGNERQHWTMNGDGSASPTGQNYSIPDVGFFLDGALREGHVFRRDLQPPVQGEWWYYSGYRLLVVRQAGQTSECAWFYHDGLFQKMGTVDNLADFGVRNDPLELTQAGVLHLVNQLHAALARVRDLNEQNRRVAEYQRTLQRVRDLAQAVL